MADEVVPKEQMEVFDRPREMAEPAPEEMMADEPQAEMSDTGLRRDDPKLAFAAFATFLVDLQANQINQLKTFTMSYPRVTEAVSETLQMAPEELNDLFDASLGDPQANQRMLQKFGGEEAMAMEEPMQAQAQAQPQMPMQQPQPQPPAQAQPQMPMQPQAQPRFEKGGIQVPGKGTAEKLVNSAEMATLAVLNETENTSKALSRFERMQDEALASNFDMSDIYKLISMGDARARESFLNEGGNKLNIAKKYLPFTQAWRSSAKVRAKEKGVERLVDRIGKEIDIISDGVKEFLGDIEEGFNTYGQPLLEGGVTGQGIDNTLAGRTDLMKALSTGEKSGLFGTGEKPRGSITPERAAFRDTRGLVSRQ